MGGAIKPRERTAILQSLRAGVVPAIGLQHIQVGRKQEVQALVRDIERIEEGGATARFVIGRFGSGKSFLLNLVRTIALERGLVVFQADLGANRRLWGTKGQARRLYAELMRHAAVRSKPEGGALPRIVEQWVSDVDFALRKEGAGDAAVAEAIQERLGTVRQFVSGHDFSQVVRRYYQGYQVHDTGAMECALRWLRAEYATRTEARRDLGVRAIIDDHGFYDYLKLMAAFCRMAGYRGVLVNLDEMNVVSHRLNHGQAREANYETLLRIVNDVLQGRVLGLGFVFAGTDAFFEDRRRGVASYEALATRLSENAFAKGDLLDWSGPVLRLNNLSVEELYVLFENLRTVFANGDPARHLVPDDALQAFLDHCSRTLGAEFYRTPRDAVKAFVGFLSVLEQNPDADWRNVLGSGLGNAARPEPGTAEPKPAEPEPALSPEPVSLSAPTSIEPDDDELFTFTL